MNGPITSAVKPIPALSTRNVGGGQMGNPSQTPAAVPGQDGQAVDPVTGKPVVGADPNAAAAEEAKLSQQNAEQQAQLAQQQAAMEKQQMQWQLAQTKAEADRLKQQVQQTQKAQAGIKPPEPAGFSPALTAQVSKLQKSIKPPEFNKAMLQMKFASRLGLGGATGLHSAATGVPMRSEAEVAARNVHRPSPMAAGRSAVEAVKQRQQADREYAGQNLGRTGTYQNDHNGVTSYYNPQARGAAAQALTAGTGMPAPAMRTMSIDPRYGGGIAMGTPQTIGRSQAPVTLPGTTQPISQAEAFGTNQYAPPRPTGVASPYSGINTGVDRSAPAAIQAAQMDSADARGIFRNQAMQQQLAQFYRQPSAAPDAPVNPAGQPWGAKVGPASVPFQGGTPTPAPGGYSGAVTAALPAWAPFTFQDTQTTTPSPAPSAPPTTTPPQTSSSPEFRARVGGSGMTAPPNPLYPVSVAAGQYRAEDSSEELNALLKGIGGADTSAPPGATTTPATPLANFKIGMPWGGYTPQLLPYQPYQQNSPFLPVTHLPGRAPTGWGFPNWGTTHLPGRAPTGWGFPNWGTGQAPRQPYSPTGWTPLSTQDWLQDSTGPFRKLSSVPTMTSYHPPGSWAPAPAPAPAPAVAPKANYGHSLAPAGGIPKTLEEFYQPRTVPGQKATSNPFRGGAAEMQTFLADSKASPADHNWAVQAAAQRFLDLRGPGAHDEAADFFTKQYQNPAIGQEIARRVFEQGQGRLTEQMWQSKADQRPSGFGTWGDGGDNLYATTTGSDSYDQMNERMIPKTYYGSSDTVKALSPTATKENLQSQVQHLRAVEDENQLFAHQWQQDQPDMGSAYGNFQNAVWEQNPSFLEKVPGINRVVHNFQDAGSNMAKSYGNTHDAQQAFAAGNYGQAGREMANAGLNAGGAILNAHPGYAVIDPFFGDSPPAMSRNKALQLGQYTGEQGGPGSLTTGVLGGAEGFMNDPNTQAIAQRFIPPNQQELAEMALGGNSPSWMAKVVQYLPFLLPLFQAMGFGSNGGGSQFAGQPQQGYDPYSGAPSTAQDYYGSQFYSGK